MKDFINEQFVEKYQLTIEGENQEKSTVELADGTPCTLSGYVSNVMIQMYPWKERRLRMEVLPLQKYDAILGKPWLYDHNPRINWRNNVISLWKKNKAYKISARANGKQVGLALTIVSKH